MQELLVVEVIPREKGRTSIRFDNGMEVLLYKGCLLYTSDAADD